MQTVQLFDLASQQARWLTLRQSAVANNVANANTPGYQSVDIEPFEAVLNNTSAPLAATHPAHVTFVGTASSFKVEESSKPGITTDGSNVNLEGEISKAGEIRRSYELNTAIVKAFHRMLLMTARA